MSQYNEFHQQYTSFGSPYGAQRYKHQLESSYEIKELSYELASDDDMTAADLLVTFKLLNGVLLVQLLSGLFDMLTANASQMSNHSDPIHGCWPPHIQQLLCISTLNDTYVIIHYIVHNRGGRYPQSINRSAGTTFRFTVDDWELVGDTFTGGSSLQLSAPVTRADKRLLVVAYQMLSAHPQRLHPRPLDSAWSLQALSSDQLVGVSLRGKGVIQDRAYGAGCAHDPSCRMERPQPHGTYTIQLTLIYSILLILTSIGLPDGRHNQIGNSHAA
ncbi:hypothetical protein MIR68_007013 [Amoeboaphelidium protococcarum]|nr:hypothetical protein MIR68_007013 [Amoeboaphelidium protococcarum]